VAYRPAGAENYHSDMRGLRMLMVSVLMFTGLVSAPGRAPVVHAAGPRVVINEIYYHAPDDNPANDYIELLNPGTVAVALTGWCFSGVDYCFSPGANLTPGAITVIAAGMFGGSLSNGGERIRLLDQTGAVVDQVTYDDAGLWPAVADGEGLSLERRDPAEPGDDPGNWSPAFPSRGLPNSTAARACCRTSATCSTPSCPRPVRPSVSPPNWCAAAAPVSTTASGFGPEIALVMRPIGGGRIGVSIPGQAAGALVRYRLLDTTRPDSAKRLEQRKPLVTWPRSGDGANYTGTTVATGHLQAAPLRVVHGRRHLHRSVQRPHPVGRRRIPGRAGLRRPDLRQHQGAREGPGLALLPEEEVEVHPPDGPRVGHPRSACRNRSTSSRCTATGPTSRSCAKRCPQR
jgi:hypothetical protein